MESNIWRIFRFIFNLSRSLSRAHFLPPFFRLEIRTASSTAAGRINGGMSANKCNRWKRGVWHLSWVWCLDWLLRFNFIFCFVPKKARKTISRPHTDFICSCRMWIDTPSSSISLLLSPLHLNNFNIPIYTNTRSIVASKIEFSFYYYLLIALHCITIRSGPRIMKMEGYDCTSVFI